MKNWEILKHIAYSRQLGYTTAISTIQSQDKNVKIITHNKHCEQNFNREFRTKKFKYIHNIDSLRGSMDVLIPDNSFLYSAVRQAEERIIELECKLKLKEIE